MHKIIRLNFSFTKELVLCFECIWNNNSSRMKLLCMFILKTDISFNESMQTLNYSIKC